MNFTLLIHQKDNRARRNESNLPYVQAAFSGRTFLRSNYDTNMVFDDISDSFTGIGKTYTLKVGGADTTGVDLEMAFCSLMEYSKLLSTENNAGNNYELIMTPQQVSQVLFTQVLLL